MANTKANTNAMQQRNGQYQNALRLVKTAETCAAQSHNRKLIIVADMNYETETCEKWTGKTEQVMQHR